MTDETHTYWNGYLRAMADDLGLRDWKIILRKDPPEEEDFLASVSVTKNRRAAAIFLSETFFTEDAETQRQCVIHELIHCHMNHARFAYEALSTRVHPETYATVFAALDGHLEMGIDGLAEAIASRFPLPEVSP